MAEDLRQLAKYVRADQWPHVACPVCIVGHLAPDAINHTPSARSLRKFERSRYPLELEGTFHGLLRCANHACREPVAVTGDYTVDVDTDDDGWTREYDFFRLRFALPTLKIILPPAGTPKTVTHAIDGAAAIIWAEPGAAANRLRFAIDELLTARKMRRFHNSKGKRVRLTTDQRIREFRVHEPAAADALEAVKWIGNQGSHESGLTATDVLDGSDLLSHALRILYDRSEEQVRRRIQAVNKRRRLPSSKRTR